MSRLFKANQYYNQLTQNKTELSPGTISACVTKIFNRSRKLDTHRRSEKNLFLDSLWPLLYCIKRFR